MNSLKVRKSEVLRVILYFTLILLCGCATSNRLKRVESKIDFLMRRERGRYIWVDGKGWEDTGGSCKPYLDLWKIEIEAERKNGKLRKLQNTEYKEIMRKFDKIGI